HLPRLFDRFHRPDWPDLHKPTGTGLGLAIVKSIMELHGGNAIVESTLGMGTSVRLRFPVSAAGSETASPTVAGATATPSPADAARAAQFECLPGRGGSAPNLPGENPSTA
ncbi:MAG TPA: sensor histidine kinase, partial [Burkholderiales bacterium]|nr:sensor histidine kinase [Burkholderiales bacterium]